VKHHKKKHLEICKAKKNKSNNNKKIKDNENNDLENLQSKYEKELLQSKHENEILKIKMEMEMQMQKMELQKENEILKLKLENEKNMALIVSKCNITTNNNINQHNINQNYIMNNFNTAYNYDDLMKKECSEDEVEYILKYGPIKGSIRTIQKRCIDNMPIEKRPLHCVDISRKKILIRIDNVWQYDINKEKLFNPIANLISKIDPKDYKKFVTTIKYYEGMLTYILDRQKISTTILRCLEDQKNVSQSNKKCDDNAKMIDDISVANDTDEDSFVDSDIDRYI